MASETSELTFVRCPSCRSLVPASAHRCRICNNTLEATGKSGEGEGSKPAGRVRQKTISANAEDLLQAQSASGKDRSTGSAAPPPPASPADDLSESDPLGAYLQDLEDDGALGAVQSSSPSQSKPAASLDDDLDDLLGDFGEADDEPEVPAPPSAKSASPRAAPPVHDELDDGLFDDFEELPKEPPLTSQERSKSSAGEVHRGRGEPPARSASSRIPSAPPPASHSSAPRADGGEARMGARPQRQERQQGAAPQTRGGEHREHQGRDGGGGGRTPPPQRPREETRRPSPDSPKGAQRVASPPTENQEVKAQSSGPKTGRMRPGRLFGWLVSFESADGRAIELREGKFFVTGTSIRGTDLVIEDPSISTPHAMMSMSAERGLLIQDLMSDRGIFVRSGEQSQYRREENLIEVKHGDWVRFGDVEFLVTIVPSGK